NGPWGARRKIATTIWRMVTARPAQSALAIPGIRFTARACRGPRENVTSGQMEDSAVSPILYGTAVTARFFDAAVLALFASRINNDGLLATDLQDSAGFRISLGFNPVESCKSCLSFQVRRRARIRPRGRDTNLRSAAPTSTRKIPAPWPDGSDRSKE